MMQTKTAAVVIMLILILAAALTIRSFQDPITNDGALYPVMAQVIDGQIEHPHFTPHSAGIIPHPPLYQMSLALIAMTAGNDFIYFRLFGVLCALLNCFLIAMNIRLIMTGASGRYTASSLAIGAYLLNPFGRLGMLVTDIDYAVVAPTLLLACYLGIRYSRQPTTSNLLYVMLGQALALWAKLTSSLVFPFVLAVRLMGKQRKNWRRAIAVAALVGTGGLLIFIATWWLFCVIGDYPAFNLLRIVHVFKDKTLSDNKFLQVGRNVLGSTFWFGPSFLLLGLTVGLRILKDAPDDPVSRDLTIFVVYGWILFAVYLVVGGIAFTMPKYQYPVTVLLSVPLGVLLTKFIKDKSLLKGPAALFFVFSAVLQYFAGDPLYHLFGELRRDAYATGRQIPSHDIRVLAWDAFLAIVPLLICGAWATRSPALRFSRWLVALTIVMFGYDLGLGLRQAGADYVTTYNYGTRGAKDVLATIRPGARVLVHEGAIYGLWNDKKIHFMDLPGDRISATGTELISMIKDSKPDYFVMGLAQLTLPQLLRLSTDPDLQAYLKTNFTERTFGDFIIYERREVLQKE